MYSACKLHKQDDSIQPWRTPFLIWNQSAVPCLFLTVVSWPADKFLRRQVWWSDIPISLRIFHSLLWSTVKGFSTISETEVDVLKFTCFFYDLLVVGNLISDSSAFSKSSLYIWKFSVQILLKPDLKGFEHYLSNMWNECNCAVVWPFFCIALLWNLNENWPFPVLWPLLNFLSLLTYWMQHCLLGFWIAQLDFHHLY